MHAKKIENRNIVFWERNKTIVRSTTPKFKNSTILRVASIHRECDLWVMHATVSVRLFLVAVRILTTQAGLSGLLVKRDSGHHNRWRYVAACRPIPKGREGTHAHLSALIACRHFLHELLANVIFSNRVRLPIYHQRSHFYSRERLSNALG